MQGLCTQEAIATSYQNMPISFPSPSKLPAAMKHSQRAAQHRKLDRTKSFCLIVSLQASSAFCNMRTAKFADVHQPNRPAWANPSPVLDWLFLWTKCRTEPGANPPFLPHGSEPSSLSSPQLCPAHRGPAAGRAASLSAASIPHCSPKFHHACRQSSWPINHCKAAGGGSKSLSNIRALLLLSPDKEHYQSAIGFREPITIHNASKHDSTVVGYLLLFAGTLAKVHWHC